MELPTRPQIFENSAAALEPAARSLDDAVSWLRSDWAPVGANLTDEAASARSAAFTSISQIRRQIEELRRELEAAAASFGSRPAR